MHVLYGSRGSGAAAIEAALVLANIPFRTIDAASWQPGSGLDELARVNPLAQIPTLVLPDGSVMTESAAITLHLADVTGSSELVPFAGDPARPQFLRWLVFTVANIYPTFTYADDPQRFVADAAAGKAFAEAVGAYRRRLWTIVEGTAGSPT